MAPSRRAEVVEPRLQLGGGEAPVGGDDGGDEVAGLDDDLAPVIAPGQIGQVGADPVDEGVDVLGEDPGHGRRWYKCAFAHRPAKGGRCVNKRVRWVG